MFLDVRRLEYSLDDWRLRWGIHDGIILALARDVNDNDGGECRVAS
jgi:hypothetical protein